MGAKDNVLKCLSEMIETYSSKLNYYIQNHLWEGLVEDTKKEINVLKQFANIIEADK